MHFSGGRGVEEMSCGAAHGRWTGIKKKFARYCSPRDGGGGRFVASLREDNRGFFGNLLSRRGFAGRSGGEKGEEACFMRIPFCAN